mmetsp:Transcript_32064/g.57409  ORF Transcript_32064/g.57409 Transcript_32064/m.57409 type:complete len:390 (-) Transcript_32064:1424-2593(-)
MAGVCRRAWLNARGVTARLGHTNAYHSTLPLNRIEYVSGHPTSVQEIDSKHQQHTQDSFPTWRRVGSLCVAGMAGCAAGSAPLSPQCQPPGNGATTQSKSVEAFDEGVEAGVIFDPNTEPQFAEPRSRLGPNKRKRAGKKFDSEAGVDLLALQKLAGGEFESCSTQQVYLSWMVDYYEWYRTTYNAPSDDARAGKTYLNAQQVVAVHHQRSKEKNLDNSCNAQPETDTRPDFACVPYELAVAPALSVNLVVEFMTFMLMVDDAEQKSRRSSTPESVRHAHDSVVRLWYWKYNALKHHLGVFEIPVEVHPAVMASTRNNTTVRAQFMDVLNRLRAQQITKTKQRGYHLQQHLHQVSVRLPIQSIECEKHLPCNGHVHVSLRNGLTRRKMS